MQMDLSLVHKFEHISLPSSRIADTIGDNVNFSLLFSSSILTAKNQK